MSGAAIFMMILGILVLWGGLAGSIFYAVSKSKGRA
ncbi:methionine/alanine import family NSS transporter small subunit [Sporosarcina sp. Sa2YVA2]|uniref:Methionine/alanine import family NSS transporter small subunit n=1 Tax=Sporosarcina quadrami TaxID=2762234 RepID=A0ABR8UC28_9BACL|nr:methionine/alanine import family NSS transporter small subunit [Sporosarcina quadrami]MBD7985592.1 methionine/alanine import family NSS transporter small subunit [Sporosarcina quadrami]